MQTLRYPPELIDRRVIMLQRDLHRLLRQYRRGQLDKFQCQTKGEDFIVRAYEQMREDIQNYLRKKGILFEGDISLLQQRLSETLMRWGKICDDFN